MKNLAASIHARLAQLRAKTGEDYNVLLVRFTGCFIGCLVPATATSSY